MKIQKAMLFFNPSTREVRVIAHPLREQLNGDWIDDSGAAYAKWDTMTDSDRARHMFASAIRNSVEFNIPIKSFFDALNQVEECRECLGERLL